MTAYLQLMDGFPYDDGSRRPVNNAILGVVKSEFTPGKRVEARAYLWESATAYEDYISGQAVLPISPVLTVIIKDQDYIDYFETAIYAGPSNPTARTFIQFIITKYLKDKKPPNDLFDWANVELSTNPGVPFTSFSGKH